MRLATPPRQPAPLSPALNEREAARVLGLSVHTLRSWRRQGRGPAFEKHAGKKRRGRGRAGRVTYRQEALQVYLAKVAVETEEPAMPQ